MVKNFFLIAAIGLIIYFFIKNEETDTFEVSFTKHPDLVISNFNAVDIKDMKIVSTSSALSMSREKDIDKLFQATFSTFYEGIQYNFSSNKIDLKETDVFFDGNVTLLGSNDFDFKAKNMSFFKNKKSIECKSDFKAVTNKAQIEGDYFNYNLNSKDLIARNIKVVYETD